MKKTPDHKTARLSGFLYLVVVITGIFNLLYVPSQLIVWGDAAITFSNISQSEALFRMGIIAGVLMNTAFLLLPLMLYRLLHEVSQSASVAMVGLSVVSVPFSLFNLMYKVNVLSLLDTPNLSIGEGTREAQVLLQLEYYNNGIELISIFWGLWLLPFGYLVYKSGFLPKILGFLLMLGCFGYLINFIGGFLFEDYHTLGISRFVSMPASLGEIGICVWLLVFAARKSFSWKKLKNESQVG